MGELRQSRTERRAGATAVLISDRDLFILEALGKLRFATTRQLTVIAFGSTSATNKRLRKLLDAGLVRAWVRSLTDENTYALTVAGRSVLRRNQAVESEYQAPRRLDGNIDHLLGINTVRVSLASQLSTSGAELCWWRSDWELRAQATTRVIPDAIFQIEWEDGERLTASLELDHHTKSPRRFLKKVLGYASMRQRGTLFGASDFAILVVGHNARRMDRYRTSTAHVIGRFAIWFTTIGQLQQNALGPIWEPLSGERQSLRDLRTLPYGKEGETTKALDAADVSRDATARLSPESDEPKPTEAGFGRSPLAAWISPARRSQ